MRRILSALLIALAMSPSAALADEGFAVFPGLTTGIGFLHQGLDSPGWTIGAEVSAVHYIDNIEMLRGGGFLWAMGGYADALWDFGSDSFRMSVGPELVWLFFGIDGGYLLQLHDGAIGHGLAGRAFFSLGFVSFYSRIGSTWGAVDDTFMEVGFLFKIPIVEGLWDDYI
jgi:hypothetical protein